jgi:DNA-binding NtrC family response regulator
MDDDPNVLKLFRQVLQMSGYNVSSFTDPHLTYQHIKENLNKYSCNYQWQNAQINALFLVPNS